MKDKIKIKIDEFEAEANKKTFSTGNTGYGFYSKIQIGGETFLVLLNIIKLLK